MPVGASWTSYTTTPPSGGTSPPNLWRTAATTACGGTGPFCRWRRRPPPRPCGWAGPLSIRPTGWPGPWGWIPSTSRTTARIPHPPSRTGPPPWRWSRPGRRGRTPLPAPPPATPPHPWRATRRRPGCPPTSLCPAAPPGARWPSCGSSAPRSSAWRAPMRTPLSCPGPPSTAGAGTTATPPSTPTSPRAKRPSPWRFWSSSAGAYPTTSPCR